jgi:hypothetical protein
MLTVTFLRNDGAKSWFGPTLPCIRPCSIMEERNGVEGNTCLGWLNPMGGFVHVMLQSPMLPLQAADTGRFAGRLCP